jgi:hypothetical protein
LEWKQNKEEGERERVRSALHKDYKKMIVVEREKIETERPPAIAT